MVEAVHAAIQHDTTHVWIHKLPLETLRRYASEVEAKARTMDKAALPLYGIPFAIKDNIDLAGVPTTAACPGFAYTPKRSATVVQRLIDAGAIPIGKTNLDQFATGLNGTRSPYGLAECVDPITFREGRAPVRGAWRKLVVQLNDTAVPAGARSFNTLSVITNQGMLSKLGWCACRSLTGFPSLPYRKDDGEFLKSLRYTRKTFIQRDKGAAILLHNAFRARFAWYSPQGSCNLR